jgi:RNA polymerase sigma factor (sigma-70 family)
MSYLDINEKAEEYYKMVCKIAFAKLQNRNDVDDIAQEVFLRYTECKNQFASEEHLKWWLIRVTVNCCINLQKSGWAKRTLLMTDELMGMLERKDNMFVYHDEYKIDSDVYEAVMSLAERYKDIIMLFYYNNFSTKEIAYLRDMKESTVRSHLFRARTLLRQKLDSRIYTTNCVFQTLNEQLQIYFERCREYYKKMNLYRKVGFGAKLALLNIDFANGWTKPGQPFSCDADSAVQEAARLCDFIRDHAYPIPIYFSRTIFNDYSFWKQKMVGNDQYYEEHWSDIDYRLNVRPGETIITKQSISCFKQTNLHECLQEEEIDTLIITGVTACGAVRYTAMDAYSLGYRVIVPKETIADRICGAIEWTLFDLDMSYCDVETTDAVMEHIRHI